VVASRTPVSTRRFDKYEGTGNDFLVLDACLWPEAELTPALARSLCDRHTGVGGDGVLWVRHLPAEEAARLIILNADGSRPEMCGNGVRCVAAWLADRGALAAGRALTVLSDAGPRVTTALNLAAGAWQVQVDMGEARVAHAHDTVEVGGRTIAVRAVNVGNPHGVVFATVDDPMATVRAVTALPAFPNGVNVEFVAAEGPGFRVRVHERGVGWTMACGTGACAVAAAAVQDGLARAGSPVAVTLDGGTLSITVDPVSHRVRMTGPARRVFSGEIPLAPPLNPLG
jgi:diaminopimelate epimerase